MYDTGGTYLGPGHKIRAKVWMTNEVNTRLERPSLSKAFVLEAVPSGLPEEC